MAEDRDIGLTKEIYEGSYVPTINTIGELILSHPEIPDGVQQADLLTTLSTMAEEMRTVVDGKLPAVEKLEKELDKSKKLIRQLQDTNQKLFLDLKTKQNTAMQSAGQEPPKKKSFDEIKRMIDGL